MEVRHNDVFNNTFTHIATSEVVSNPPVPLKGMGIQYHREENTKASSIGLILIPATLFDFSQSNDYLKNKILQNQTFQKKRQTMTWQ